MSCYRFKSVPGRHAAVLVGVASSLLGARGAWAGRPIAGAVTSERVKLPSGPSSVRGLADEPTVDPFYAQLDYQVPIELPAGFGGLSPALALTYSGALGNGPLGIGWTLAEPRIQRSTRLGVPKFDDSDVLEIAGIASGRLIAIAAGEYRVEGSGQTVRVRRVGAGFEVDDGQGVHYRLGVTASARQEGDATHTLAWRVEDQTNQMGERIRYEYAHDRGQVYLSRITWGPADRYTADLRYEPRSDATTSYREGFRVVTGQRLAAVTVTALGVQRRSYQLAYDATFPVARLAGVSSTGLGGSGAWPALSFSYAVTAPPVITPIAGIGNWRLNSSGTTLVDLDGDGAADLLQLTSGGHSYLTNQNGTFGGQQPLTGNAQAIAAVQLQDVDGDGRAELVQDTGNGWAVYKFTRTQWVSQAAGLPNGVWPGTPGLALKQPSTTRFADLNGDGLIDAIQWDNDNLKVHLATRTGLAAAYNVARIGGSVLPSAQGRFHDASSDGLDDYLVAATDRLDVYIGHGDGTFEPVVAVAYPFAGTLTNPDDLELADLDRDGLMDLVRVELGTVRWFRGSADGTFTTAPVTLANPETLSTAVVVAIADSNGNGSQDVVWSSTSGMWRMDLAGTTTAGMLTRVQNGLGMDVTFAYRSSHALAVEAAAAGSPWGSNVPIALPVPVQRTTALGLGETTRDVSYGVRDGSWDAAEQRFAGFLTTTVTTAGATAAETSSVITRYNAGIGANRVLRGRPLVEQVKDGTGRRLSITTSTWEAMPVTGLPDVPLLRRAVLREQIVQHEDTVPVRKTSVTYSYDPLGRVAHAVDSGRLDITGDESVKDTQYGDDDAAWIRDRVCDEKVSSVTGVVVSDVQHLFGDDTRQELLCVIGKGWPRETRSWLAGEARFVTTEQLRYDGHGNPVAVTSGGVERRLVYDASGLYPIEEHVTAAPGRELIWRASWDGVLGVTTAVTDPNGHTTHASYDSLGRFTGVAIDDRPQHQAIEYDWTAPYPKTTVWTFDGALTELGARPAAWSATARWRQSVEVANGKGEVRYRAQRLAEAQWIISDYRERDANSRVVFAGRPVYATQLELSGRPAGEVGDQLVYDPLGRLIEQRLPTGAKRTYRHVAFERVMQDADRAPVRSVLDGQGRALLTERSLADGTHEIVEAVYDAAGRLTRMTLAGGAVQRDFTYDTLGRLVQSHDPDLGTRSLTWDDGGRLLSETNAAGQVIRYTYDGLGRLATRDAGGIYRYHYDEPRAGASAVGNAAGRLAWLEEPTGGVDVGYDELGRVRVSQRRVDGRVSEQTTSYAASGLALTRSFDDGFSLSYQYDPAGRLIGLGNLWQLLEQDASGQVLHELAHNGVDTRYTRDVLGLASRVTVRDAGGAAIYDVAATRNLSNDITAITDLDGGGLDHSAQFGYDGFARLTSAALGGGFSFGYGYDVLHNMTTRTTAGPRALGAFAGHYRHGEAGQGPRQLTSIADDTGAAIHSFRYDAAGRQIGQDAQTLGYDPADRLVVVSGGAGGTVQHAYGHDGLRVKTVAPDGTVSLMFAEDVAERAGVREHDVAVGDRIIARVAVSPASSASPVAASFAPAGLGRVAGLGLWGVTLALIGVALVDGRRRRPARPLAAALVGILVTTSCSLATRTAEQQALWSPPSVTYFHAGFGAGPVVFTDAAGQLLEERRYEPFGAPVDARIRHGASYELGAPDLAARDVNALNKRTELTTGWSDHGARWLAPETGRWLTPDPPVAGPDVKFMFEPWALHPYQYVDQNPISYWDPDGREPRATEAHEEDDSPEDELIEGAHAFIPGYGQLDGLKLAISPLQSKRVPTPVKVAYAIVSPIPIFVLGVGNEFVHTIEGLYHLGKGSARILFAPMPSPLTQPALPAMEFAERNPGGGRRTWSDGQVAYYDAPPPAPVPRPTPRRVVRRVTPRPAQPRPALGPEPFHADGGECVTRGRKPY